MIYQRKYLQFNELVFDNYDMLSDWDGGQITTKVNSSPFSFGNGSYVPQKDKHLFFEEYSISMTLELEMKKIPCDFRRFYRSFVIEELSKAGKLWAIQNNELVWAYAICTGSSEGTDILQDKIIIDVDFLIYEGVWHKAHKQKTFLIPFNICGFLDCLNYQDYQPCKDDCLDYCRTETEYCEICTCDTIEKENALCYNINRLQEYYFTKCNSSYKIIQNCEKALEFFTTDVNKYLGKRYCSNCNDINASVYIDTDIPTREYELVLHGCMSNPYLEVNNKGIVVKGEYNGYLFFYGNGEVYYQGENECCKEPIDLNDIIIKAWEDVERNEVGWYNDELGFTFKPRHNSVVVDMGMCPSGGESEGVVYTAGINCLYVNVEALTI